MLLEETLVLQFYTSCTHINLPSNERECDRYVTTTVQNAEKITVSIIICAKEKCGLLFVLKATSINPSVDKVYL